MFIIQTLKNKKIDKTFEGNNLQDVVNQAINFGISGKKEILFTNKYETSTKTFAEVKNNVNFYEW